MDVFNLRDTLVEDYQRFARSFTTIKADDIRAQVEAEYRTGRFWPDPLIQVNPRFEPSVTVADLAAEGRVHPGVARIFRFGDDAGNGTAGTPLRLHLHQRESLAIAQRGESFVVTTGTGSGKSLCFFIPLADAILKAKATDPTPRTRAVIVYPMNALANSQSEELQKFPGRLADRPITFARYTGQEEGEERERIRDNPPDILLTNFMMLELLMTRQDELDRKVIANCEQLRFLILDELHTYRGRQGADVAMLVRRVRERLAAPGLVCIGTSATMASEGDYLDRNQRIAEVASRLFAADIPHTNVVTETLVRITSNTETAESIAPRLAAAIRAPLSPTLSDTALTAHPLAIWLENTVGLAKEPSARLVRAKPQTLRDAVDRLAADSGVPQNECMTALTAFLLLAAKPESERTGLAGANLQEMLQSGTAMDAPTLRRLEGLLAWITVREGLADTGSTRLSELANQAGRGHPVVELAARAGIVQREGEELRRRVGAVPLSVENVRAAALRLSAASRWTPQAAADWAPVARFGTEQLVQANALALRGLLESQRWSDALLLADALAGSSIPQLDSLRAEVTPIAFRGALEASIAESMRSGNWDRARTLAQRVRSDFAANPALAVLASTVEQEAIPASTRRFYQQAQQQFAAGDLEVAWETYGLAQDSANQHYGDFITAQREYLRQQLFIQFLSRGEGAEVAGYDSAAMTAYLRASEFDNRVDARVAEMLARGVPAPRGTVDTWRRRAEERSRLPRVLRVTSDPPGVDVVVEGRRVGLTPIECTLPPTDAANVSAQRSGWTQSMSAPLPPGRIARVHFSVPADTVAWPAPRSRQELAQDVLRIRPFTPTVSQPLQPPVPVKSSLARVALALVGGVGGMLLGIQIGPGLFQCTGDQDPAYDNCSETAGEAEATGALLTGALGALIGWVGGRSIDNSRFAQAQGRMTDYPPLLEAWQRNVSLERERWIDGRLGPVQQAENARVARGVGSARATNDTIRQANSRLGPPRLEILPMERGGGLPRACLGSPSTDRPTSERSRRLPDTGRRSEFWSGSISGLLGYGAMSIRLAWSGNSFAGSLFTLEGESIISDGALKGSDISWSAELIVDGVRRLASFRGRLVGNRIGGQVFIPTKGGYSFALVLSAGP